MVPMLICDESAMRDGIFEPKRSILKCGLMKQNVDYLRAKLDDWYEIKQSYSISSSCDSMRWAVQSRLMASTSLPRVTPATRSDT